MIKRAKVTITYLEQRAAAYIKFGHPSTDCLIQEHRMHAFFHENKVKPIEITIFLLINGILCIL